MTQKAVLQSECDNCGATETSPMPASKRATLILPKDWIHVQGNTATTTVFELDVCPKCSIIVKNAVGKGDKK